MLTQKTKDKFNHFSTNDHPSMEHFFTFYNFGKTCGRIVEMGVDYGVSTWAWVACEPKYFRGVDIRMQPPPQGQHAELQEEALKMGIDYQFVLGDTGHGILKEIERKFNKVSYPSDQTSLPYYNIDKKVDLLYIDTYHSYTHLKAELAIHGSKVNKYLIFHDTHYFGEKHDYDGDLGLNPAIREFVANNPEWYYIHQVSYGNGCTVLGNSKKVKDKPNMDPLFRYPPVVL